MSGRWSAKSPMPISLWPSTSSRPSRLSAPPNFVTHVAISDRMREAIDNLISNAIKYSPIGGKIAVVVSHERNNTIIRIADEGAGLSPEDLGRLFGRFQRLSAKTNRRRKLDRSLGFRSSSASSTCMAAR